MAEVDSRRRTTLRWAAGIVGGLAVVAALAWPRSAPPSPSPVGTAPVAEVAAPTSLPPTSTVITAAEPSGPVWAEADLRAVAPAALERTVEASAERVLRELFTADGSGRRSELVPAGLPDPEPGARSFVEWVSVATIDDLGAGRFRVEAMLGRLVAAPGADYRRLAPEAFSLVLDVSTGTPVLVDLPTPSVPVGPTGPSVSLTAAPAPPVVVEAAEDVFSRFGTVTSVEAFPVGDRWRVVGAVVDAGGMTWPLVVWLDADGVEVIPDP